LKITEAIRTATTEHVVYFLLTAYVETLDYYDPPRSFVPEHVRRLPVTEFSDVSNRLRALRTAIEQYTRSKIRPLIKEAVEVFTAALQRLRVLQNVHQFVRRSSPFYLLASNAHRSNRRTSPG
jgi:hypothetical protein